MTKNSDVMTATHYRALLRRLNLTQAAAARLAGAGERTGRRWAERGIRGPAAILWRLVSMKRLTMRDISAVKHARGR